MSESSVSPNRALRRRRLVPAKARIERDLPIEGLVPIAGREGNRKRPVYQMHKWWARRLGSNFRMLLLSALLPSGVTTRRLWKAFYSKHRFSRLVVLDPFMGGGTSIVEAGKLGSRTIGNDIDPVAWFVTKKEVEPFDEDMIRAEYKRIEDAVAEKIRAYYRHRTPEGTLANVTTYFWVTVVTCSECERAVDVHPHHRLYVDKRGQRQAVFCRECDTVVWKPSKQKSFTCKDCGAKTDIHRGRGAAGRIRCECGLDKPIVEMVSPGKPFPRRLFALEYECPEGDGREFAKATEDDRRVYDSARTTFRRLRRRLVFPRDIIPKEERYDRRPLIYGFRKYEHLFNERQLLSLALIYEQVVAAKDQDAREYLLLAFSDALASNNLMCAYAFGYRKLTPLFGLHAYRFIARPVEGSVWGSAYGRGSFSRCFEKMLRGKQYCLNPYELAREARGRIYTGERLSAAATTDPEEWSGGKPQALLLNRDAARLIGVPDESVDVILTDPPYYNNMPYSELSDFYYVWLRDQMPSRKHRWKGSSTPYREGLFVRRRTIEEHQRFQQGMTKILMECNRVLRRDGIMVFTYHHNDRRAWTALCNALLGSEWEVTNVMPLLAEGKSGFHSDAGNIKWDSVIVCRPRSEAGVSRVSDIRTTPIVRFSKRKVEHWVKRLELAGCSLSDADRASLAFSFGLWAVCDRSASESSVLEAMNAIAREVNGATSGPQLFRAIAAPKRA